MFYLNIILKIFKTTKNENKNTNIHTHSTKPIKKPCYQRPHIRKDVDRLIGQHQHPFRAEAHSGDRRQKPNNDIHILPLTNMGRPALPMVCKAVRQRHLSNSTDKKHLGTRHNNHEHLFSIFSNDVHSRECSKRASNFERYSGAV